MEYYITYRNMGRLEKTPVKRGTADDAKKKAEFLKFQGAKAVKIHYIED